MQLLKKAIAILIISILISISFININVQAATKTYTQTVKSGISAFPEDYQVYLKEIQKQHPTWTFDAYYTGISWNELVTNETNHGHNRVIKSADPLWKCSCGNVASGYACASSGIIKYFMDPRNSLTNDVKIFQFLEISYNEKIHTVDGIQTTIKNTFLNDKVAVEKDGKVVTMTYAEIILEAAKQSGMSPYSIATKIIQEVGSGKKQADGTYKNTNSSISGTYVASDGTSYKGYYNFFNYGAHDEGNAIENGLKYAKEKGWNSQYKAIIEGAKLLANSYTNAGQNTAYFYKWDVVGTTILKSGQTQTISSSKCFGHQYMTNIQDPTSQASSLYRTYTNNNLLDQKLNFIIPIYDNMPDSNKLPTKLDTLDGDLYYTTGTDIMVRATPSISGARVDCISEKDTIVAVLERKTANNDGLYWDKVKLANGKIGYSASKYLEPCKKDETSDKVRMDTNNVTAIPNITAKQMASELKINSYEILNNGNKVAEDSKLATGYVLKNKENNQEYKIVVLGDANGDGQINSGDLLKIQKHLLKVISLNNTPNALASDVTGDGQINSADLLKIQKHLLGVSKIEL